MTQSSRLRPTVYAALLFVLGITVTQAVLAGNKGTAYVSNQNGGVTVIDLESMEAKGNLDIGAKGPRGIGVSADGKWLITANKDDDNISITDTSGNTPPKLINIGKNPEFVRIFGEHAYVTYEPAPSTGGEPKGREKTAKEKEDENLPGHIAIVDLKTGKVINDIVGKPETEGIEFSKDGKEMVVTNESDDTITVHDIKTGKLLKNIPVRTYGERPRGIKVSPDGKTYVSTLEVSGKLLVLDSKLNPIKTVDTGKMPYGIAYDRDGKRIFVAANKEKSLQVFDTRTYDKIKDIPTGERCWHFSFTPDDQHILLACGKSNEIVVIDTQKLEVIKRIPDKDMPWGIVTYPKSMGSLDRP